ncbi:MAG TPA: SMC-Scp complex subunit ScpB [bacterium (Candidatus Stahlbacteria)]|nr:SMC-Scp complex subunit ScpB [Candidatus Stahlbacteria bacterium]
MNDKIIEALLFATPEPLPPRKIAEIAGVELNTVESIITELNRFYEVHDRPYRIRFIAGGYQLYTVPSLARWVDQVRGGRRLQLSRAALETLAIIAYNQPITKGEIERRRGVDSTGVVHTLLEAGMISTAGRERRPGRPYRYRTTKLFLKCFGLKDISELPPIGEESGEADQGLP